MTPIIIAELGSSPAPAWDFDAWCLAAARSGATHCKVQLFLAEHFPREEWEQKRPLEFPRERLAEFVKAAHRYSLRAGASVFDTEAVRLVAEECDFIKLAAREQQNTRLAQDVFYHYKNKMVFRSFSSVKCLMFEKWYVPFVAIPEYPASMLKSAWSVFEASISFPKYKWGWSSHTTGDLDVRLAVRLGARAIEKHFCLSHDDPEGGHSLTPSEFKRMVERITK